MDPQTATQKFNPDRTQALRDHQAAADLERKAQSEDVQEHAAQVDEPSNDDRIDSLIASYQHGMDNNAPRNPAELEELRYLLGREDTERRERREAEVAEQNKRAAAARKQRDLDAEQRA